jgi:glutathione peroxidase
MEDIYALRVNDKNNKETDFESYRGKVLLIVNTATECGFAPQLKELEELYQKFKDKGFLVLGFPSNDFGNQEPRENDEMEKFCQVNFGVSFPFLGKSRVRGPYANELFKFFADKKRNGKFSNSPRWNFQKYLINRKGELVDFYYPITKPGSSRLRKAIEKCIQA